MIFTRPTLYIPVSYTHLPDETGQFTDETYNSLIRLTAWLCGKYDVGKDDIIRHYDVTGKDCPRYYVKHKKKWDALKRCV